MVNCKRSGEMLTVFLSGEIDHCLSDELRDELENEIRKNEIGILHFDFSKVSFIDSSGIGLLIGRYKTMRNRGGIISAGGMSESVGRLYHMAGLHRIIPIAEHGGEI